MLALDVDSSTSALTVFDGGLTGTLLPGYCLAEEATLLHLRPL